MKVQGDVVMSKEAGAPSAILTSAIGSVSMYIQYTPRALKGYSLIFFNQCPNWREPLLPKGLFQQLFIHIYSMNDE